MMRCAKCLRPVYYDMVNARTGSRIPVRDEIDERTFCPEGGSHESEHVADETAAAGA